MTTPLMAGLARDQLGEMLAKGWSYSRIAKKHGISSASVRHWCLAHGLKSKHKPIVRRRKKSA